MKPLYWNHLSVKTSLIILSAFLALNSIVYDKMSAYLTTQYIAEKHHDIKNESFLLQESLSFLLIHNELEQIQKSLSYLGANHSLKSAYILNTKNTVIASIKRENIGKSIKKVVSSELYSSLQQLQQDVYMSKKNMTAHSPQSLKLSSLSPLLTSKGAFKSVRGSDYYLYMNYDLSEIINQQRILTQNFLLPFVLSWLLLGLVITLYIHIKISRRINRINKAVTNFSRTGKQNLPQDNNKDEISSLTANFTALTEQVTKQNANLNQYKQIVSSSSDLLALLDKNLTYQTANSTYLTYFQLKQEKIEYKHISEVLPPEIMNKVKTKALACLQGETISFQFWFDFPAFGKRYVDAIYTPYYDDKNEIAGLVISSRDITDRKLIEDKIHQQKIEQEQILNNMADAVITLNEDGLISSFNQAACEIFIYEAEYIIGKNIALLIAIDTQENSPLFYQQLTKNITNIIAIEHEIMAKRSDGTLLCMNLSIAEIAKDEKGKQQFIATCRDLTFIKEQELKINRTQKLDALGKLSGGIAHDYNNMLGVILSYCEILDKKLETDPELNHYVKQIANAGNRGAELTRKLLSFSKVHPTETASTDINQSLLSIEDMLTKSLTAIIELSLHLSAELWPVNIDNNAFQDCVLNLCINAKHAMPEGGLLAITTENEILTNKQTENLPITAGMYVSITFQDNGIGMSDKLMQSIFEPFFTTKAEKGTGLGLSQVFGFCNASKGAVDVSSQINKGACFTIYIPHYFPLTKTACTDIKQQIKPSSPVVDATILVVDDETQLCDFASEIIQNAGYSTLKESNPENALQLLKTKTVDLLFTDIIMPKMNGYQLAKEALKQNSDLQIIFCSGYQDELTSKQHEDFSESPLLNKPYSGQQLLVAIQQQLSTFQSHNTIAPAVTLDGGMLDAEHQRSFFQIQQIIALTVTELAQKLRPLLSELLHELCQHFKHEDLALKQNNYPYYKNHKNVHQWMINELDSMMKSKSVNHQQIQAWISSDFSLWLTDHVRVMDVAAKSYLSQGEH